MKRPALVLLLLLAAVPGRLEASEARSFALRHRAASEAVALVAPLLSPNGSVVLQPQVNTLLIRDSEEVIGRIAELLARWDVPPASYRLEIRLLLASNVEPTPAPTTGPHFRPGLEAMMRPTGAPGGPRIRTVRDDLARLLRYRFFTDLDRVVVTATDGTRVEVPAAGRYYVRFTLRAAPWNPDRVQLSQLELIRGTVDGRPNGEHRPLFRANVSLRTRQTSVIGTARSEDAEEALVLVLNAEREESE